MYLKTCNNCKHQHPQEYKDGRYGTGLYCNKDMKMQSYSYCDEYQPTTICETCVYCVPYCELDDNLDYILDKTFFVCMLTDAEVHASETCKEYEQKGE